MRLNDEEQAMRAGALGEPRRWAIEHQIAVGEFFDAVDLVPVSQAHIMADTESLGEAGVRFLEGLAGAPESDRRVRVPTLTDPRGLDVAVYKRLGQSEAMRALEARAIAALRAFGVLMTEDQRTICTLPASRLASIGAEVNSSRGSLSGEIVSARLRISDCHQGWLI